MLKVIGVKADAVILEQNLSPIYNLDIYLRPLVTNYQFNHAIVWARIDNRTCWLDPTKAKSTSFCTISNQFRGRDGLVLPLAGTRISSRWETIR